MIRSILRLARARRIVVLAGAIVLAAASVAAARRLAFDADVLHLLPREGRAVPAFRDFLERFGSLDYLYLVFEVEGDRSIDEFESEITAFANRLAAAPEVSRIDLGPADPSRNWGYVADRLLLLLGPQLPAALERLEPGKIDAQLASTRELLSLPAAGMRDLVQRDPIGLFQLARAQLAGASGGLAADISEAAYVSADGRSRLVLARPVRPPFDTAFSHRLFDRLEAVERETLAGVEGLRVQYAGGHHISLEIERTVRHESVWNGVGSLALILPLLYLAFRSWWLVAVGAIPSALAILVVLALNAVAGRTLSAAATGAAAMQFGLGIDGVVLLFVAFRHLAAEGVDTDAAAPLLAGPAASMLLGMWTTAATFYGLAIVDFPSLEELGLLIGHGMLLCGVLTLVLVPAVLPRRSPRTRPLTAWWLSRFVAGRARAILIATAVVTVALALAATRIRVDPSLDRLRARTSGTAFEEEVARRFGVPQDVYMVMARGPALEPLLEDNERLVADLLRDAPRARLHAPTALLPSQAAQSRAAALVDARRLNPDVVRARIVAGAATTGFRPGTFDPFLDRLPRLLDPRERLTHEGYRAHGLQDLLARSIVEADGTWMLATYVYPDGPATLDAVRRVVEAAGGGMQLTGVPEVNRELGERFGPEFLKGLAAGTVLVITLLAFTFRRLDLTALALVPTIVALVWAAGGLALFGVSLDLFSVFAVVTFVGIGVDYGIHVVHRVAEGHMDTAAIVARLGPVILVAAATTLLGFGTLVFSSYPPLRSLGLISVVMVTALAATSLLVLPALLMRGQR